MDRFTVATIDRADLNELGPLTDRQERFAQAYVQLNNASAAYRVAYRVQPKTLPNTITRAGSALSNNPKIAARVKQLRSEAAAGVVSNLRELATWYYQIATADPNELIAWVHTCCRHCYGVDHAYQWKNEDEFTRSYMEIADEIANLQELKLPCKLKLPDDAGGYGYDKRLDPVLTCPECCGGGEQRAAVADTTKLTGKARLLYKGIKVTKQGIEVLMHDQDAARESLGRMMGAFKDSDPRTFSHPAQEAESADVLPESISAEDAARAYLRLMG